MNGNFYSAYNRADPDSIFVLRLRHGNGMRRVGAVLLKYGIEPYEMDAEKHIVTLLRKSTDREIGHGAGLTMNPLIKYWEQL